MSETERELWEKSDDPLRLLQLVAPDVNNFRATVPPDLDRKLRLIAVGCARLRWHERTAYGKRAVELAEAYADGRATGRELDEALKDAMKNTPSSDDVLAHWVAPISGLGHHVPHCLRVLLEDRLAKGLHPRAAALFRCVLGDWHQPVRLPTTPCEPCKGRGWRYLRDEWPEVSTGPKDRRQITCQACKGSKTHGCPWLAWEGGVVARLARAIYDERRWGELPILADALEEAGCAQPEMLAHLRAPGPHCRGCFPVDLLLGHCAPRRSEAIPANS